LLLLRAHIPIVIHVADTCTAPVPTRLGLGDKTDRNTPTKMLRLRNATQLAAGTDHSLALHGDSTLSSFGRNTDGQ